MIQSLQLGARKLAVIACVLFLVASQGLVIKGQRREGHTSS